MTVDAVSEHPIAARDMTPHITLATAGARTLIVFMTIRYLRCRVLRQAMSIRIAAVGDCDLCYCRALNLLGAIFGGVLEYSSLVIGFKALYIVAAVAYFGAFALTQPSFGLSRRLQLAVQSE